MTEETSLYVGRKLCGWVVKRENRLFVMINGWAGQEKESDRRDFRENFFGYQHGVCAYFSKKEYMVKDDFLGVFGWIGWREKCGREIGEKEMKIKQNSKKKKEINRRRRSTRKCFLG